MDKTPNRQTQRRNGGIARRGVRAHFDLAVAMITVIPFLCVLSLVSPEISAILGKTGQTLVVGIGLILSPGLGYTILAKYPLAIIKLKRHLADVVRGEIPDQIDLLSDETDVLAVEQAVNAVLDRLRERVVKVSAVNDLLQDELLQSRKLEAVGTLAYGVAHEIATPLQILRSNMQFVCEAGLQLSHGEESPLAAEIRTCMVQAEEAAEDISATLSALRDFAPHDRKSKLHTETDLNETIRHTAALSRNEWKYVADVDMDLDSSLPSVLCAAGEIKQILVNLTLNAVQAIRVHNEEQKTKNKGNIEFRTRSLAEGACIEVSDSGCGIPSETVPRVFDPFLSTDSDGVHHGRGLSLAYATVVHDHGGRMTCRSTQGKGTTISFVIPYQQTEVNNESTICNA